MWWETIKNIDIDVWTQFCFTYKEIGFLCEILKNRKLDRGGRGLPWVPWVTLISSRGERCGTEKLKQNLFYENQKNAMSINVFGSLWQSVTACCSLWQPVAAVTFCATLWDSVAVLSSLWRFVTACCSLWQSFPNFSKTNVTSFAPQARRLMFALRSAPDYPFSIFSVSFVFSNSLLFCLISTVLLPPSVMVLLKRFITTFIR